MLNIENKLSCKEKIKTQNSVANYYSKLHIAFNKITYEQRY